MCANGAQNEPGEMSPIGDKTDVGELIAEQRETVGLAQAGRPKIGLQENPINSTPTLAQAGIDKNLANRARKLAKIESDASNSETVSELGLSTWRRLRKLGLPVFCGVGKLVSIKTLCEFVK